MSRDFTIFKSAVAAQFERMSRQPLFYTAIDKERLWNTYLDSFPPGTNDIRTERRKYDCRMCYQFVRDLGNVVTITDGILVSIWDTPISDPVYAKVAADMSALVRSANIKNEFLHHSNSVGTDHNLSRQENGAIITWQHFYAPIRNRNNGRPFVCAEERIATEQGDSRNLHDMFLRALTTISKDSVETVLDLISENNLYRGEENTRVIKGLQTAQVEFAKVPEWEQSQWIWEKMRDYHESVAKIRNSSIGTLLVDLSEGKDLEDAVGAYEFKVAPGNFKRTTALVSTKQVEAAKKTLDELGLTSALDRRFAKLSDISVNDILFVDRSTRGSLKKDVFSGIARKTLPQSTMRGQGQDISISDFMSEILPNISSMEIYVENRHAPNFVSLIAPTDPSAPPLFKWKNGFSWAYNGDVTDSIVERVKKAGGNVTGDLCCRLAWDYTDDLDLHMIEPNGRHIYYADKVSPTTGGELDVDRNAHTVVTDPVENIFYQDRRKMIPGIYQLRVHNYRKREFGKKGFEVEIAYLGNTYKFIYEKEMRQGEIVVVAEMQYSRENGISFVKTLPSTQASRSEWGVDTQTFHPVNLMMLSPNHWDGQSTGNRHFFFIMDGCKNDGSVRPFYNEFLKNDLTVHRKVMEIVGSRMKIEADAEQLSGLGFSSTQRNTLLARVKGDTTRTLKISF